MCSYDCMFGIDMDYTLDVLIMNNELCCVSYKSDPRITHGAHVAKQK